MSKQICIITQVKKKKIIKNVIIINEIHDFMPNDHNLNSSPNIIL